MKSLEQQFVTLFNKSPKVTLNKINKLVKEGYVSARQHHIYGELTIFNYAPSTTFERNWDLYSMVCRGLVIDTVALKIKAIPFAKFFNLGELDNTELSELSSHNRTHNYNVFYKMDGSLGIGFIHKNTMIWATRGSFISEQAQFANTFIRDKYTSERLEELCFDYDGMTIMAEIIYPTNKIVVNYKGLATLVLLTMFRNKDGKEIPHCDLILEGVSLNLPVVEIYESYNTLSDIVTAREEWDRDIEGVVIVYSNGKRLKIKGMEYLKFHKARYGFSSKQQVEFWRMGTHKEYLEQLDEEYRKEVETLYDTLTQRFNYVVANVKAETKIILDNKMKMGEIPFYLKEHSYNKVFQGFIFNSVRGKPYDEKIKKDMYKNYRLYVD